MNMHSNDYLKNQIATASREQLLIMFYDGAIRFTVQAQHAIKNDDIEGRNYAIQKASAIIAELSATLDHKIGGQIAADLDALYAYMLNELNMANIENKASRLETVEKMLTELRQTWVEAIKIFKEEKQGLAGSAKPQGTRPYHPLSVAM
jgi:flagellar protein FliS